jgi:hypothetical protein
MHSRWRADIMAAVVYKLEQWYLPHDFQGAARGAPVAEHLGSADLPWPSFAAAPQSLPRPQDIMVVEPGVVIVRE